MQPTKVLPIYFIHHLMAIFRLFHQLHHFDKMESGGYSEVFWGLGFG